MKAAIIEEVGKLSIKDIQGPVPGDYDVLCETQYGALCTGTDTHLLHYHPPFCNWIKLPAILGHESIGKVIQLGSKVRHFKVGDMITRVGHPGVDGIDSAWGGFSGVVFVCRARFVRSASSFAVTTWSWTRIR